MIWVLVVLSLNLPMGKLDADQIGGVAYDSESACMSGLLRVHQAAVRLGTPLNAVCMNADNNTYTSPQPNLAQGTRRPT